MRRVRGSIVSGCVLALLVACDDARRVAEQEFVPADDGYLTVATALPAPGFWNGDDADRIDGGFEWAIAAALADRFDLELRVVDVPFDRIVSDDLAGADIAIAQISATEERDAHLDFSTPYYENGAGVLAREDDDIRDLKTARERVWGVVAQTTEGEVVDDVIRPDEAPVTFADETSCAAAIGGAVDACLMDLTTALLVEQSAPGTSTVARIVTGEQWAIVVAESDNLDPIDAGLHALDDDGSIDDFVGEWLAPALGRDVADIPVIEVRL